MLKFCCCQVVLSHIMTTTYSFFGLDFFLFQVPETLEIAFVKEGGKQFPGLFLFTGPARMVRPVYNLAAKQVELVGTFEQVYMDICITQKEAYPNVS